MEFCIQNKMYLRTKSLQKILPSILMHLKYRVRFLVLTLRQVTPCWGERVASTDNEQFYSSFLLVSKATCKLTGQHKLAVTQNKVLVKSYKHLTSLMASFAHQVLFLIRHPINNIPSPCTLHLIR